MNFMILGKDIEDGIVLRAATRPRHLKFWQNVPIEILLAGPLLDNSSGEPKGSMLVVEANDIEAVRSVAEADPYFLAGVFSSLEIVPMRLGFGSLVPAPGQV